MTHTLQRPFAFDLKARLVVFLVLAGSIYAVASSLALNLEALGSDWALVAAGVTLDLAVLMPALYWLLLVRGGAPRLSIVPVTLLSLFAAGAIVPSEHHGTLRLLEALAFPLEIGLVAYLFWAVRKALRVEESAEGVGGRGHVDPFERMSIAARRLLGEGRGAEILASEAAVFYFAFATWRDRPAVSGPGEVFITHHRKSLYAVTFWGILMACLIEVLAVHFLLIRWSEPAAWILTGLSIYGVFWLMGDYRAVILRPSRLSDDLLEIRLGLRWQVEIPLAEIITARRLNAKEKEDLKQEKDVLKALLVGEPSHLIELKSPVEAKGPYGLKRSTRRIALAVDQEKELESVVSGLAGQ